LCNNKSKNKTQQSSRTSNSPSAAFKSPMTTTTEDDVGDDDEPAGSLPTTNFDVIVLGTGLAESLVASSAAKVGKKSILVLDANDRYGNSFGTLMEEEEEEEREEEEENKKKGWRVPEYLLRSGSVLETRDIAGRRTTGTVVGGGGEDVVDDDVVFSSRRRFSLDVAFKFSLGDDRLTEEVCNSEAYKYLEFKTLEKSFVGVAGRRRRKEEEEKTESEDFEFVPVPASRAEIFENARLSPAEKRGLMRFLKKARDVALEGTGVNYGRGDDANAPIGAPGTEYTLDAGGGGGGGGDDDDGDDSGTFARAFASDSTSNSSNSKNTSMKAFLMESPNDLSEVTSDAVTYCVSFCPSATTSMRGRASEMLKTYIRSMGKYGPETPQAGLIPLYGSGEVAQAFCRAAAVSGAITALRQPIRKIERKNGERCIEVVTNGGRVLTCEKLVLGDAQGDIEMVGFSDDETMMNCSEKSKLFCINRAVLVTNRSIIGNDDAQQRVFIAIPSAARPGKLYKDEDEFVCFATQLDYSSRCCPKGTFIVHLCQKSRRTVPLEDVFADVLDTIFSKEKRNGEETEKKKPTILWGTSFRTPDVDDDIVVDGFKTDDFVKFPGADCNATFEDAVLLARSANHRLFGREDANAASPPSALPLFPKTAAKEEEEVKEEEEKESIDEDDEDDDDEYALLRDL
jgi:RAB protein geranylgeranyltransferase component A